jgi:hypothetical protein
MELVEDLTGWYAVTLAPATRVYEFHVERRCRSDLRQWFEDHHMASDDVRLEWKFLPSQAIVWFRHCRHATLFKLTWA